jgi:hypothetical protein
VTDVLQTLKDQVAHVHNRMQPACNAYPLTHGQVVRLGRVCDAMGVLEEAPLLGKSCKIWVCDHTAVGFVFQDHYEDPIEVLPSSCHACDCS